MADTDVFGLLSLLLAAAGAVYLVWARVLRPGVEKEALSSNPSPAPDRAADTLPPVLRPEAELSPKMLAKREALKQSSRPPPPGDAKGASVAAGGGAPGGGAPGVGVSQQPAEAKAPKAEAPTPKAEPSAAERAAPKSDPKPALSKKAAAREAKKAKKEKAAASATSKAVASSAPTGVSSSASAASTTAPAVAPAKRETPFDDVPRIDVEDDDDVEPTKVGRFVKEDAIQPMVEKIVFDDGADKVPEGGPARLLIVFALSQTDVGKRRKQNEDSLLVLEGQSVYAVADGMGGHRGGQYASKLAVKTLGEAFESKMFDAAPHKELASEASELARAIQMANSAIFHEAKLRAELTGMGTTLCAVRFTEDKRRLFVGHVGDSRCYRLRDGVMKQLTNDHTMADYGVAGPEGAHLSRALGVWPTVPIDVIMAEPKLGDVYLLCSDGLTKMVPDTTIATQLLHEEDPKAAVERLVFFANAAGGKDNITIILLRVVEEGWNPPTPPG